MPQQGQSGSINSSDALTSAVGGIAQEIVGGFPTARGYIANWQSLVGGHGAGTGRAAARGQFEGSLRAAQRVASLQAEQERAQRSVDLAYADFGRTNPFEQGFAVEGPTTFESPSPKTAALVAKNVAKLQQLSAKAQSKKVIAKERKISQQIALRVAKLAPTTEVRISELRGPNAGYWRERGAPAPLWLTQRRIDG